jgi:hypothetical protein
MQKFQFPLEKALEWRTIRLELENAKLAQLRQEKSTLLRLCEDLRDSSMEAARGVLECKTALRGADLGSLASYRQVIAKRLKKLSVTAREYDGRIEEQTRRVVEADREKQLLVKLKERQFAEWDYEMKRELENTAGELFLARWSR